jgi:antibiotic biosynthesis monooxygenase (ABM) superfamily enzyme
VETCHPRACVCNPPVASKPGVTGTLPIMIVRLVTATVRTDRAGSFNALMRAQLPILREHPGLVYVKLARRVQGDIEEVLLYEEWRDTASLYGWTGPELARPRLVPGAEELLTDVSVAHYEALDIEPPID